MLSIGINKRIFALKLCSFIPLILEIVIVIMLNSKIKKVVHKYAEIMGKLYKDREKNMEEERIEAYNDFINNKEKRVQ